MTVAVESWGAAIDRAIGPVHHVAHHPRSPAHIRGIQATCAEVITRLDTAITSLRVPCSSLENRPRYSDAELADAYFAARHLLTVWAKAVALHGQGTPEAQALADIMLHDFTSPSKSLRQYAQTLAQTITAGETHAATDNTHPASTVP